MIEGVRFMSYTMQLFLLLFLFVSALFLFGMNIYLYKRKRNYQKYLAAASGYRSLNQTNGDQSYYGHH